MISIGGMLRHAMSAMGKAKAAAVTEAYDLGAKAGSEPLHRLQVATRAMLLERRGMSARLEAESTMLGEVTCRAVKAEKKLAEKEAMLEEAEKQAMLELAEKEAMLETLRGELATAHSEKAAMAEEVARARVQSLECGLDILALEKEMGI